MIDNELVVKILQKTTALLEIVGENPFKAKSFAIAAQNIASFPESLESYVAKGIKPNIPGVGAGIWKEIVELFKENTFQPLQEVLKILPPELPELLNVPGIGPKKIQQLWIQAQITSPKELLQACYENKLLNIKGFGEKSQKNIQRALEFYLANQGFYHLHRAYALWDSFAQKFPYPVFPVGELRRFCPTIQQIEGLTKFNQTIDFQSDNWILNVQNDDLADFFSLDKQHHIRIYKSSSETFYKSYFLLTGSQIHIEAVLKETKLNFQSEEEIYQANGFTFVPPECREGIGELENTEQKVAHLIDKKDIAGIFHAHTTWSDGANSLTEMVDACKKNGYHYLGISDHSQSAFYANGLSIGRVTAQQEEIRSINQKLTNFTVFSGIESDILPSGELDYPEEILKTFDFVIASIHSSFNMNTEEATRRLIKAIENPYTRILGHPTGRLLLIRSGYPIHHQYIIDACAANHVAIELNCNPYRLDIDWTWIPYMAEKNILCVLSPDAHSLKGIQDIHWGVQVARKGMLAAEQCVNCWNTEEVRIWLINK